MLSATMYRVANACYLLLVALQKAVLLGLLYVDPFLAKWRNHYEDALYQLRDTAYDREIALREELWETYNKSCTKAYELRIKTEQRIDRKLQTIRGQ